MSQQHIHEYMMDEQSFLLFLFACSGRGFENKRNFVRVDNDSVNIHELLIATLNFRLTDVWNFYSITLETF